MKRNLSTAARRTALFALLLLPAAAALTRSLPDFTELVAVNAPAVVNISTTLKRDVAAGRTPGVPEIPPDSPLYEFFRKFFGEVPDGTQPFLERAPQGSGFIISADGYVITNNHVIDGAEDIVVRLNDRRELNATIVGSDARTDIALLRIDGADLPSLKLGDSSKVQVGEWVLAIGSPFGFDHSVTAGIISAIGRSLPNENYVPFIQTDVAINPGNSGGPLFNLRGEVIGVNSQIYSRTGGFMGLSFAVPINVVNDVYRQLRDTGRVSRGWLGVLIQDVTGDLAESFGLERSRGALVAKILPDSPAAEAGLEVGDVILRFDGRDIPTSSDLPPMVGASQVGKAVPIDIVRHGKRRKLEIRIAELPEEDTVAERDAAPGTPARGNSLNLSVRDLTVEERGEGMPAEGGVLVEQVQPGAAAAAGIRAGDVILQINNEKVDDAAGFERLAGQLPADRSIPVLVQRRGNPIFLALKLPQEP